MHFGNLREMSVKIGKDRKLIKNRTPSGKRLVHSVSGRHNAPGLFRKASETFLNFRSLPSSHGHYRGTCRHRTKFFEVYYTSVTLSSRQILVDKSASEVDVMYS